MSALLLSVVLGASPALAGYGDAYEVEVSRWDDSTELQWFPSWEERAVHLWTNAVRVDPEAFEADYNVGGCSFYDEFSEDEQTPKAPVYIDAGLNEAARWHSEDMLDNTHFAHESSPAAGGMDFSTRVARWYQTGMVSENIAYGYEDEYTAVMQGWMCSTTGHRENIMSATWTELGTGVDKGPDLPEFYYTQDFGSGTVATGSPVAMGLHDPLEPTSKVTFYADFYRSDSEAPSRYQVVVDGVGTPMDLAWGEEAMGVYETSLDVNDELCHQYYIGWAAGSESGTWPADGSYTYGANCDADWVPVQQAGGDDSLFDEDGEPRIIGCSTSPGAQGTGTAALALLGLLGLWRRRT